MDAPSPQPPLDTVPPGDSIELRAWAERILFEPDLSRKLAAPPSELTDRDPGPSTRPDVPARPENLRFCGRKEAPPMPPPATFHEPRRRGIAHHIMANHELQALEVMALVILAFPEAPLEFRLGMAPIMRDEQRHTRMHVDRAFELGVPFGSLPVNGYFWGKSRSFTSVIEYLAGLPLTFEGCNLDHTLEFEAAFLAAGDRKSAGIMRAIHRDEIGHVAFGLTWLRRLKPSDQSDWDAYASHLQWPLRPEKSRGKTFHAEPRLAAGMSPDFIARLAATGIDPQDETAATE
jgi:uncharacterized ferritin-like protein (DUF455 family)